MRLQSAPVAEAGPTTQDRETGMTDTQVLLGKIAALRQRLEQAQGLARDADSAAATLAGTPRDDSGRVWRLERQVESGADHAALLDGSLRQISELTSVPDASGRLPRQLTSRARRILEESHDLLGQLRGLAEQIDTHPPGLARCSDPVAIAYRETSAMTETVLRVVQAFPDAASAQLRLCEGVEAILGVAAQRLATLSQALGKRRHAATQLDNLANLLAGLASGKDVSVQEFTNLAEAVLADADQTPLCFPDAPASQPGVAVAAHSITVARVVARIVRHDAELRSRPLEPVLAALVHDVGMLRVPTEAWLHAGALD